MFLDSRAASHSLERSVTTSHSTWKYYKTLPPPLRLYPSVPNQSRFFFFSEKGVTYIVRCRCQMVICEATAA